METIIKRVLLLSSLWAATSTTTFANEQSIQVIQHGFALRQKAVEIQQQAIELIRYGRTLDKTAIKIRQQANKSATPSTETSPSTLNQASSHLSTYGANFREAHNDLMNSSDLMLKEGFMGLWNDKLTHKDPMRIQGSFADGETSEFLKMSFSAQNKPDDLDVSISRATSNGLYYVAIQSQEYPIKINEIHNWKVIVADKNAKPVSNLSFNIEGDMPSHGHGMPTTPVVTAEQEAGTYLMEGVKFQMRGWWIITFNVEGEQGADTVSFNLDL